MTDDQVAAHVLDACRRRDAIEREMALVLAVAQQRRFWAEQGGVSLGAWVETRTGQRREDVNRLRKLGQGMRSFPAIAALPIAKAQLVLSCKPASDEDVDLLVGLGHKLPLRDFALATQRCKFLRDANGTEPEAEPARSELHLSPLLNGSYSVRGTLTGTDAKIIVAALEGEVDRAWRNGRDRDPADEGLTVPQLRASGLVDLISQTMRREPSNDSIPDRYRVAIIINPDEPVDKLALCDSTLYRAVLDAESLPSTSDEKQDHGPPRSAGRSRSGTMVVSFRAVTGHPLDAMSTIAPASIYRATAVNINPDRSPSCTRST